jgi:hypothetical protein
VHLRLAQEHLVGGVECCINSNFRVASSAFPVTRLERFTDRKATFHSPSALDQRIGDLARSLTEIWLDRMPTSPTSPFFVHRDRIGKHRPT